MSETNYLYNGAINLLFTGIFYCFAPLIIRIVKRAPLAKKVATTIAVVNSVTILLIFTLFYLAVYLQTEEMQTPNLPASLIWFFAARAILRFGHNKVQAKEEYPVEESRIQNEVINNTNSFSRSPYNARVVEPFASNSSALVDEGYIYCNRCGTLLVEPKVFCQTCGYKMPRKYEA